MDTIVLYCNRINALARPLSPTNEEEHAEKIALVVSISIQNTCRKCIS